MITWLKIVNGELCLFGSLSKTAERQNKGFLIMNYGHRQIDFEDIEKHKEMTEKILFNK